ncbi:MAG: dTMP kinase [Balneolaceae bacterium]
MLITFEGIDGCGKSTQVSLLKGWLEAQGSGFALFREPGGTELSEKIRELLLDSGRQMDPVTELLLFSAARSQLVTEKIIPLLEKRQIVILDRFYDSTTAYQGYGRKSASPDRIDMVNRLAAHNLVPDITFYLKISAENAEKRLSTLGKDRMELSGSRFFKDVAAGFEELSSKSNRFHTLNAELGREEIHRQIVGVIRDALS